MSQLNQSVPTHRHENIWSSFIDPLRGIGESVASFFSPTAEASDSKECYEINLELPGVVEEDVDVSLEGDMLVISGEKKSEREETDKNYYFSERRYGKFYRTFRLPADSIKDKIDAHFSDGVLKVTIPKNGTEGNGKRRIEINPG